MGSTKASGTREPGVGQCRVRLLTRGVDSGLELDGHQDVEAGLLQPVGIFDRCSVELHVLEQDVPTFFPISMPGRVARK